MILGIKNMTQSQLEEHFRQFGEVEDCVVLNDSATGQPKGFGFLVFRDTRSATECLL